MTLSNRRTWHLLAAAALAAVVVAAAAAADVFAEYGLDRQAWADAFVGSMTGGGLYAPGVPAKLKAVPPAGRAAVVTALGTAAKVFFQTAEFKAQYKQEYEAQLPDDQRPPRTAKDIAAEMKADIQKGFAEMEEAAKEFQGDMRKQMEAGLARMRAEVQAQLKSVDADAAMLAAEEKARYDEAKSRPPDPDAPSPDPAVSLRRTLKAFLDDTANVDFAAATKTEFGMRRFVKADYESKPKPWKMCYRAGTEACGAARSFATAWLTELK